MKGVDRPDKARRSVSSTQPEDSTGLSGSASTRVERGRSRPHRLDENRWEGTKAEELDCYILIKRSGCRIQQIKLGPTPPARPSKAAVAILEHLRGGPLPDLVPDLSALTGFQRAVLKAVGEIPRGSTLTYGQVAALVGRPGASRAVGRALASNPLPILIPCHRVVSRRDLGGFSYGLAMKEKLLSLEKGRCSQ